MQAKHTPGPWQHRLSDDEEQYPHEIMGAWQRSVRRIVGGVESLEDSRLITAAPELLAVLQDFSTQHRCGCEHPYCKDCERDRLADAAIAKALGNDG